MSDEQWLREVLQAAAPQPPPTDRLGGIRSRRVRSRRRLTVLAATIAVGALALAITVSTRLAGQGTQAPLATDPLGTTAAATTDLDCPPPATSLTGPDSIPARPVAVRLCSGAQGIAFASPIDLLVTDPGRVAEAVDDQPVADLDPAVGCTAELGRAYELVFGYPDGSTAVAAGELYGCRPLMVGRTKRSGADVPWDTFLSLLRAQRRATSPPPNLDPGLPTCTAAYQLGPSPLGGPEEIVAGRFCARVGKKWVDVPISQTDLRAIVADYRRATPLVTGSLACLDHREWAVVGTTAWGDLARLQSLCGWYMGKGTHGADPAGISPEVRRTVDTLLKEVTGR